MAKLLALLRAVNVGGRKAAMAELRALCGELGWSDVETYIQSGNIVFAADAEPGILEAQLEQGLKERFGFDVPVLIRTGRAWTAIVESNPMAREAEEAPNRVMVALAKARIESGAAEAIAARAAAGEKVVLAGDALWFHYPEGAGTSKLTPAMIDKAAGSPVTARNWRTALKLQEMLEA